MGYSQDQLEALVAWASGECSPEQHREMERALREDSSLRKIADQLVELVEAMQAHELPRPGLADRLANLFTTEPSAAQNWAAAWLESSTRIVATLVHRPQGALAGYRAATTATQYCFASELGRVDVVITLGATLSDQAIIKGQFSSHDIPAEQVHLMTPDHCHLATTPIDGRGNFSMPADPGRYALVLDVAGAALDCAIIVPQP